MSSNSDVVMSFIQAWNDMSWDGIEALFSDDVVYHNIPMAPLNGKVEAMQMIRGMQPQSVDWEVLNIAENGNMNIILAIWSPNIIFALVGLLLYQTVRR